MEACTLLEGFPYPGSLEPGTPGSAGQGLTLLHSERPKLVAILAFLSAVGLICCATGLPTREGK